MQYKSTFMNRLVAYCAIVVLVLVSNIGVNTASAVPSPPVLLFDPGQIDIQTINGQDPNNIPTVLPGSMVTVTGVARGGESQSSGHCTIWGDPVNMKFDVGFDYVDRYSLPLNNPTTYVRDTGEASIVTNLQQTQVGNDSIVQCPTWMDVFAPYEYTFEYSFDTTGLSPGLHTTTIRSQGVTAPPIGPPAGHPTSSAQYIVSGSTFACSVTPATHTVDAGSDYAYNITSNAVNGFNNPVSFTSSISPATANPPVISFTNNDQSPPATTIANINTTSGTTAGTYTLTFTGTGGGETSQCSTQLIVNEEGPNFALTISPSTGFVPPTPPNATNQGTTVEYTVVAVCTGGLAGPIDSMVAISSFMPGPTLTLGANSIPCGGSTTLTVSNTSLTNVQQLSDPGAISAIYNSITVTGRAQTN